MNLDDLLLKFGYVRADNSTSSCQSKLDLQRNNYEAQIKQIRALHYGENEFYKQQVATLNQTKTNLEVDMENLKDVNTKLQVSFVDLAKKVEDYEAIIKAVPGSIMLSMDAPAFLDQTKKAYEPYVQWRDGGIRVSPLAPYAVNPYIYQWFFSQVKREEFDKKTKYEKAMIIWDIEAKARKYIADSGDNWQAPFVTIARAAGDCEDSTALYISLCMISGFDSKDIFNAVGPTSFGYHSYVVLYFKQDELPAGMTEGWYIFESTLSQAATKPKRLIGSGYWVDSLANWQFSGEVKNENIGDFNGKTN